jgi:hypothetical protein
MIEGAIVLGILLIVYMVSIEDAEHRYIETTQIECVDVVAEAMKEESNGIRESN